MIINKVETGLYPLLFIDPVKSCCNSEYERPEWNIHFSKVRELISRLIDFAKKVSKHGGAR